LKATSKLEEAWGLAALNKNESAELMFEEGETFLK